MSEQSAQPAPPPLRLLFWESTSRCNLSCRHCRRCDVADDLARFDMPGEQVRRLLDSVAQVNPAGVGKPIFIFSGGEPLMRPDWAELGLYARQLGLPTALATNGTLVDADIAGRIARTGFRRVSLSLDGADATTHDGLRGLPGSFDLALRGAQHIVDAGVELQINSTITRHNVEQLEALLTLTKRLRAVALHLFLLVPVGCGANIPPAERITPADYEAVLDWLWRRKQDCEIQLKATCAPHYSRVARQRQGESKAAHDPSRTAGQAQLNAHTRGCLAGIGVAFVSHRGQVFPCGYLPVEAGNLAEREFEEIWANSPLFAELRNYALLTGKCGRCEYRNVCGGCRARAYSETGDYLAAEPMCAHTPACDR